MVDKKTKKKNMYTALFLASLMVIFFLYTISATVISVIFVYLSLKLKNTPVDAKDFEKKAQQFFYFTIIFLFNIFAILLIDSVVM